jgi:hypothetical protein
MATYKIECSDSLAVLKLDDVTQKTMRCSEAGDTVRGAFEALYKQARAEKEAGDTVEAEITATCW